MQQTDNRDLKQTTLEITGMTCAACATRIEKGLNKLPGVTQVNVNLLMETARIEYSSNEVSVADMKIKYRSLVTKPPLSRTRRNQWTFIRRKLRTNNEAIACCHSFITAVMEHG